MTELVFTTAPWCSVCKQVKPLIESEGIRIVDLDQDQDFGIQHNVVGLPSTIAFKNGQEVARKVGIITKHDIAKLRELIQ